MRINFLPPLLLGALLALASSLAADASKLLKSAVFCRSVTEQQTPKEKADFFYPEETVYLSVELKGRPSSGIAAAKFWFREQMIAEAKLDVADVNKGIFFSVGESTYTTFSLHPKSELPIGDQYKVEVTFDGKPLGTFPFSIHPPKGALPAKMISTTLAHGTDDKDNPIGETKVFKSLDKVVLVGRADLGRSSWLEATWWVGGTVDKKGTRSVKSEEDKPNVPFYFSFIPAKGWPAGEHRVVLTMDGKEVARQSFTVLPPPPDAGKQITVNSVTLHHDDGKGEVGEKTDGFKASETRLHVRFALEEPAIVYGTMVRWTLVKSDDAEPQEIAAVVLQDDALQKAVFGSLSIKKALPAGTYRVDLLKEDTVLASKEFKVTAGSSSPAAAIGKGLGK